MFQAFLTRVVFTIYLCMAFVYISLEQRVLFMYSYVYILLHCEMCIEPVHGEDKLDKFRLATLNLSRTLWPCKAPKITIKLV